MARQLDVYLHQHMVGTLTQDDHGDIVFEYAAGWLANTSAVPLSQSLPLRHERFSRRECRAYFGGILPEAAPREAIARNLGISAANDFAMLEAIGGECAGAVTFIASGSTLAEQGSRYRPLTDLELAEILRQLPRRPLMAGEDGVRLSLAGAQDKIAVHIAHGQVSIPLGGAPSTHIVKPAIERFEGLVFNEALCMRLARAVGLSTPAVEIATVEGIDYLLVERYDRVQLMSGSMDRLHQEDFCQALGILSEHKYQNEGGPSLKQCFDLTRNASSLPIIDLASLLDGVVFNFLIGNNDAHGKNFSLLYYGYIASESTARLAPFYDLLSTSHYPELSSKMAMKIGGEYVADRVTSKHIERFAEEVGLGLPMVKRRAQELAEATLEKLLTMTTDRPVEVEVAALIRRRCERMIGWG